MTDNEIIKALECCLSNNYEDCKDCPTKDLSTDYLGCRNKLREIALDLINRLKLQDKDLSETVHNLTIEKDALFDKAEELKAEVERLYIALEENQKATKFWKDKSETIKAEAYKEFVERLCEGRVSNDNTVILAKCLLKEMVGEDNVD